MSELSGCQYRQRQTHQERYGLRQRIERDNPAGNHDSDVPYVGVVDTAEHLSRRAPPDPRAFENDGKHHNHRGRPTEPYMQLQKPILEYLPHRDACEERGQPTRR